MLISVHRTSLDHPHPQAVLSGYITLPTSQSTGCWLTVAQVTKFQVMDPDYSVTGWVQKCSLISQEPFWKIDCNSLNVEQSSPGSPRPGPFFVRRLSLTESLSFMLFVCSSSSSVTLSSCGFLWICPFHPNFWHILIHSSLFTSDHNIPQLKFWLSNESIFISLKQNAYSLKIVQFCWSLQRTFSALTFIMLF